MVFWSFRELILRLLVFPLSLLLFFTPIPSVFVHCISCSYKENVMVPTALPLKKAGDCHLLLSCLNLTLVFPVENLVWVSNPALPSFSFPLPFPSLSVPFPFPFSFLFPFPSPPSLSLPLLLSLPLSLLPSPFLRRVSLCTPAYACPGTHSVDHRASGVLLN